MKNRYRYLKATPHIKGVNGLFDLGFIAEMHGKHDASHNQICEVEGKHVTPYIGIKVNSFDSYVDKVYLRTAQAIAPTVKAAYKLVVELNILLSTNSVPFTGNIEETQRQAANESTRAAQREKRKAEILEKISEIRTESEIVNECLQHHTERAEGIFVSKILRYWGGLRAVYSEGDLEHFPYMEHREFSGRQSYLVNRQKLTEMINNAMSYGGGEHEKNENH